MNALARTLVLALLAVAAAGCLDAPERRKGEPRPVTAKDGKLRVVLERYTCRCEGQENAHVEGVVRARYVKGPNAGATAWWTPLDGKLNDAFGPTGADRGIELAVEGKPGYEVVVVHAPGRSRRFLLATGERLD
jgi:hypothetical protein